jgi:hypothetical protein
MKVRTRVTVFIVRISIASEKKSLRRPPNMSSVCCKTHSSSESE